MSCEDCKNYSELKEPRTQKDKDKNEYTIYGYCFKKLFQSQFNTGYPVYIPNGGCKEFAPRVKKEKPLIGIGGFNIERT